MKKPHKAIQKINNQQFNNNLYMPGEAAPSLRLETLNSSAFWFYQKFIGGATSVYI